MVDLEMAAAVESRVVERAVDYKAEEKGNFMVMEDYTVEGRNCYVEMDVVTEIMVEVVAVVRLKVEVEVVKFTLMARFAIIVLS